MEKHDQPPCSDVLTSEGVLTMRRVEVDGRKIGLRLEQSYWGALDEICLREEMTAEEIIADMARRVRSRAGGDDPAMSSVSLANALRVFIVGYFRQAATEDGHELAGHGNGGCFAASAVN